MASSDRESRALGSRVLGGPSCRSSSVRPGPPPSRSGLDGVCDRATAGSSAAAALGAAEGVAAESGPAAGAAADGGGAAAARRPEATAPEADAESVARAIVLRQLSMAPRSRSQLEQKLRQRGCDPEVAERVLDRMAEVGLVDDEAYAEMLVRARHSGRGWPAGPWLTSCASRASTRRLPTRRSRQVGAADERRAGRAARREEAPVAARALRRGSDPPSGRACSRARVTRRDRVARHP